MPLYTYECAVCGHILTKEFRIRDFDLTKTVCCDKCNALAKRIISFNTGHRADPTWLPSAVKLLQADGERPIESRHDHDRYLKEHDISHRC